MHFQWALNWPVLVLSLCFLPLLFLLGMWQLNRADEKSQIIASYQQLQQLPPVNLTADNVNALATYTPVTVSGHYHPEHHWLIDHKVFQGRVGYYLVSHFVAENGVQLLVNRGWLEGTGYREQLPSIPTIEKRITISGTLYEPSQNALITTTPAVRAWPQVITQLDPAEIASSLDDIRPTELFALQIDSSSPSALLTDWRPINMSPSRHIGYAVQWFGLFLALVLLLIYSNSNVGEWIKHKSANRKQTHNNN